LVNITSKTEAVSGGLVKDYSLCFTKEVNLKELPIELNSKSLINKKQIQINEAKFIQDKKINRPYT
jgi:hypothetical protein